jgi:ABC-2 type transport system ATP-binding protein
LTHAIEADGLVKTFVKARRLREMLLHPFGRAERIPALRGADLAVRNGEIVSLLGPNGAGKTTLLKILSCLVLPDAGRAIVGGEDTIHENRVKRLIGLVHSDERSFYWRLSGRENLRFFARLYDVPYRRTEARVAELLERVDLTGAADRPFSGYSSGMKQRMAIARALLHDPPILLMDEPTRSLDPLTAIGLRQFVMTRLRDGQGKTVLIATHDLREAEVLSDRVAILVRGRVRQIGTVSEMRRWGVRERLFRLELEPHDGPLAGPFRTLEDQTSDGARRLLVAVDSGGTLHDALAAVVAAGARVRSCNEEHPDLEQAFSRIVGAEDDAA